VRRLHEFFNTRRFDEAPGLHTPGFFAYPLGTAGFEAGRAASRAAAIAGMTWGNRGWLGSVLVLHGAAASRSCGL
jgi:hypothetical protein